MHNENDNVLLFMASFDLLTILLFLSSLKCKLKVAIIAHRKSNLRKFCVGNKKELQLR